MANDDEWAVFRPDPFCDKCRRYYNPNTPHLCFPDDLDLEDERRKLKKWLGKGVETVE